MNIKTNLRENTKYVNSRWLEKGKKNIHVVTLGDPSTEVDTLPEMWFVRFLETVVTTVTEAPPSDTTQHRMSLVIHSTFYVCNSIPGPQVHGTTKTPGTPTDTYSCNNACGGDTEFIKGGDISSG